MTDATPPPSADPEELRRFERIADLWWDPGGPFWPLHRLNALRVGWLRDQLVARLGLPATAAQPLAGVRVLDIGCGGGILSESLARLGAAVTGIDIVARNIAIATRHAAAQGLAIDYRVQSVEALAAGGAAYDAVLNMEVVEHVAALPPFMAACNRLVRPGGVQALATLNRTPKAWLFAIVGAEHLLRWLPRGTHRWRKFPRPSELEALCARDGLQVVARSGVRVNPLTRQMHLCRSLAVNYMLLAVREGAASPG